MKNMNNIMEITTYLSMITLNISGLNASIRRCGMADWVTKEELYYVLLQEPSLWIERHIDQVKG